METLKIEGRTFHRENPFLIPVAFYSMARRGVMREEEKNGSSPELLERWNHYQECAARALRKAEEWEDAQRRTVYGR